MAALADPQLQERSPSMMVNSRRVQLFYFRRYCDHQSARCRDGRVHVQFRNWVSLDITGSSFKHHNPGVFFLRTGHGSQTWSSTEVFQLKLHYLRDHDIHEGRAAYEEESQYHGNVGQGAKFSRVDAFRANVVLVPSIYGSGEPIQIHYRGNKVNDSKEPHDEVRDFPRQCWPHKVAHKDGIEVKRENRGTEDNHDCSMPSWGEVRCRCRSNLRHFEKLNSDPDIPDDDA
ncbi:hypothetical protein BGX31_002335 [Mortierella sp. GBA43]|nr:hypothetical protein BGX31_002335 [Mortierella sp. GBA43]